MVPAAQTAPDRLAGFFRHLAVRIPLFVATALLLFLSLLFFPIAPDSGLDAAWQLALNHAWTHGSAFGRDLVFTYGPWGWLNTAYYDPATFAGRVIWEIAWKAFAALALARLAFALSWPRAILLVVTGAALVPLFGDILPMLVVSGLLLSFLYRPGAGRARIVAVAAVLGLLSLQKFSCFVAAGFGLACLGLGLVRRGNRRDAGWLIGAWTAAVVFWWLAAGQDLGALPAFVRHSLWSAAVYDEAMFLVAPPWVLPLGLAAAVGYFLLTWGEWRRGVLGALLLTGLGLLVWKQAFVRADQHTLGFFFFTLLAALAAPLAWPNPAGWRRVALSWSLAALSLAGSIVTAPGLLKNVHLLLRLHLVENTRTLLALGEHRAAVEQRLAAHRAAAALPATATRVGRETIDAFGFGQAALLLNGLDYHPRPVIQSYLACSDRLAELNAAFYDSPRAPRFTLAKLESIDSRFPPLDDGRLLPRLFTDHVYELTERGQVLLRHNPAATHPAPIALGSGRLRFGENYPLPAFDGRALWVTVAVNPSWQGWLRRTFYKPPEVSIVINDGTAVERSFRLILPAARAGFLISPMLTDTAGLERLAAHRTGRPARSFRLNVLPGDDVYFLKRAYIDVYALPDLRFTSDDAAAVAVP